jgi:hypothetical protein
MTLLASLTGAGSRRAKPGSAGASRGVRNAR